MSDFWDNLPDNPANEPDYPEFWCCHCNEVHEPGFMCSACGICNNQTLVEDDLCMVCQNIYTSVF
jgi:hypothetical protein